MHGANGIPNGGTEAAATISSPTLGERELQMNKPVVSGSSTGRTQAVESVLMALPRGSPGIAVVPHMPEQ